MSREILVNVNPREIRAAVVENGATLELFIERASRSGIVGNLYKGRVSRVLPGMQAAFVDIGLERTAFLHAADIARAVPAEAEGAAPPVQDIGQLVREGDDILVQVIKEPLGTKGARLSTFISLPSRFVVYMPYSSGVGVSARIEEPAERERLRDAVRAAAAGGPGGWIVRTAGGQALPEALGADMQFLQRRWEHVLAQRASAGSASLVHGDLSLALRVLRDELSADVRRVLVDSPAEQARMQAFAETYMPEAADRIEYYAGPRPLFDLHGIEEEIARALERKVDLKSGGYIVFDQTEALTTIDVNTGGYVGHRNLEETIFRTNLEAAVAIARQLRLRNLGGIIIVDFIDMEDPAHREQVLAALQGALAGDRAQSHIAPISSLGLVEMTRKRTRESLEHVLCEPCQSCNGRGYRKSVETVCYEIYREALRQARQFRIEQLLILAHPEVTERLLDEEAPLLAELEAQVKRPIRLQAEALYGIEHFDIVLA
jgi:ribonuclease G